ncbi:MAG: YajG family lipoprotein [Oleispira sp.]
MLKRIASPLLAGTLATSILLSSGCALSPQMINLQTSSPLDTSSTQLGRSALVRVRDLREDTEQLGSRGGTQPDQAPLLAKPSLQQALQTKMQNSLQQLGFGGSSPFEPLKVDLAIETFDYQCNDGLWVSQCQLAMALTLSIDNDSFETSQPFTLNEQRSVITSPRVGYNEEWINQSIDKLWLHMMSQPQVSKALGL